MPPMRGRLAFNTARIPIRQRPMPHFLTEVLDPHSQFHCGNPSEADGKVLFAIETRTYRCTQ
ncbi:hypothetical protein ADT71_24985 [Novosphingobium sp. ST904]|nr:hypothetical protein ADT71_24985 [Novosphingobium sp. ST904]